MAHQLPAVRAVDVRRLVELRVDRRHGCEVDDRAPPRLLEDRGQDDERLEEVRSLEERDLVDPKGGEDVVDHAVYWRQDDVEDRGVDHPRQEVGRVDDGLEDTLVQEQPDLVDEQGQDDREPVDQRTRELQVQR